jgi:regulator of sirC expression with transglutaminase-like and TPR domain
MRNKELNALISLIDEPDIDMFGRIREKIFSYGLEAIPELENAWDVNPDNGIQHRIEGIIHQIQFDHIYKELGAWKNSPDKDLFKGFTLVANFQYPDLDEKLLINKIGKIIQDVWLELNINLTPLEKVKVLNHIIFDVHGFKGNKKDIYAPANSYINVIFETKKANPISLSIIYMVVAQSLGIPVYGVNLPQNFILAYMGGTIRDFDLIDANDVQFYLNAFNKGAVFTHKEVKLFLGRMNIDQDKKYFLPCDNVTIIRRVLNNLIFSYEQIDEQEKVKELKRLQSALD